MRTEIYKGTYSKAPPTHAYLFDSVEEFLSDLEQIPRSRIEATHLTDEAVRRGPFIGRDFSGWADVFQAARTVWPDGLAIVDKMLADLDDVSMPRPVSRRRRTRFAEDDGNELDYDRLRSGQPFWRTSRRENTRGPATITIIVDVGANANVKHSDILWRGAAAIALTKRLEEAGYRVELWAAHRAEGVWVPLGSPSIDGFQAVCLKRPGDPLDPSTLVSAVSGWFFRTAFFRATCLCHERVASDLGHAITPRSIDLDRVSHDENRVLISDAFDYDTAVSKVRAALQTHTERN